ncbi:MAG TPA: GNAT family N-acetyltransferase [Anaerolineales bacterium]|nr:GNAT family N-acetyltransferase [Anaerolineales bacterium]
MAKSDVRLNFLHEQADIRRVVELQRAVWGGDLAVPDHLLQASIHGGGLLIGAFEGDEMVGFVFGFPAFDRGADGLVLWHHSHMLAVIPEKRDAGIGFAMKRAQWQWVRQQGLDRITWTFDPLQSRNAYLNIARLGAVASTYLPEYYGEMTDSINTGLPSDRFRVDWWVNSPRVADRLDEHPRRPLELGDYFSAGAEILNPTRLAPSGYPEPPEETWSMADLAESLEAQAPALPASPPFYLVEIPPDFQALKEADGGLALRWRLHTREIFQRLLGQGYLVTDFVYMRGEIPRSFYLFSDGERQIGSFRKKGGLQN